MQLQLSLNYHSGEQAVALAQRLAWGVDIIEIGTPLLFREGFGIITRLRKEFPHKRLVANTKLIDLIDFTAGFAFEAGADVVTVLGAAADTTIEEAINLARSRDRTIAIDVLGLDEREKLPRARRLETLGAPLLVVHTGPEEQARGGAPFDDFVRINASVNVPLAVTGGITEENLAMYLQEKPAILILGAILTKAEKPEEVLQRIRTTLGF